MIGWLNRTRTTLGDEPGQFIVHFDIRGPFPHGFFEWDAGPDLDRATFDWPRRSHA